LLLLLLLLGRGCRLVLVLLGQGRPVVVDGDEDERLRYYAAEARHAE
jgi:hypothetical protein